MCVDARSQSLCFLCARHVVTRVMWVKPSYHFIKNPNLRPVKCPLAQLKLLCKLASVNAMSHCCMPSLPWICSSKHYGEIYLFVHSIIPEKKILRRPTRITWQHWMNSAGHHRPHLEYLIVWKLNLFIKCVQSIETRYYIWPVFPVLNNLIWFAHRNELNVKFCVEFVCKFVNWFFVTLFMYVMLVLFYYYYCYYYLIFVPNTEMKVGFEGWHLNIDKKEVPSRTEHVWTAHLSVFYLVPQAICCCHTLLLKLYTLPDDFLTH